MTFWTEICDHKVRFFKTVSLWTGYMAVGMSLAIAGPTLLDLQQQVQAGITQISFALTSRAAGFVVGSLIMGVIYSRVNFLLSTSITFTASAILTFTIPHLTQLGSLLLVFVLNGACLGFFEAACNVSVLFLWGKEAMPFMQALNFMYGTGAMIAPLIAEPFLIARNASEDQRTGAQVDVTQVFHPDQVMLVYPYSITAGFLVFSALFNFALWITYPVTKEHPSRTGENSNNNETYGSTETSNETKKQISVQPEIIENIRRASCLTLPMISIEDPVRMNTRIFRKWKLLTLVLVFMFMHIYLGLEISFGSYLTTYVVNCDLKLSKATGAHLTTLFWATFTFTKVATIFYIQLIGNQKNLIASLVTMLIATGILNAYGDSSETLLWIGVGMIGIGLSSVWGCMFGYLEDFFPVTSVIGSLMIVSAMLGEFVFPVIISSFIEDYPQVLMWIVLFCSSTMTILFVFIMILCNTKLKKEPVVLTSVST